MDFRNLNPSLITEIKLKIKSGNGKLVIIGSCAIFFYFYAIILFIVFNNNLAENKQEFYN